MSQRDVENVVDKRDKFKRWHMLNKLFEICVSSYTVYFCYSGIWFAISPFILNLSILVFQYFWSVFFFGLHISV